MHRSCSQNAGKTLERSSEASFIGYQSNDNSRLHLIATNGLVTGVTTSLASTDALTGVVTQGYNTNDDLTSVKDQRNNITAYTYNAFGDVISETSPDRGLTSYVLDKAGNITQKTDARSVVTNYTYDALNRLKTIVYPSQTALNTTLTYDLTTGCGTAGKGQLCSVTDGAGSIAYQYDVLGRMTQETDTRGTVVLTTQYGYDLAGTLTSLVLPSTRTVGYTLNANGLVTGVTGRVTGVTTTLASSGTYLPFGPMTGLTYGNSKVLTAAFNTDYNPTSRAVAGLYSSTYATDANSNITQADTTTTTTAPSTSITRSLNLSPCGSSRHPALRHRHRRSCVFNDANDLGKALSLAGSSSNLTYYATGISETFIQYAGQLALNKILQSEHSEVLNGVLDFKKTSGGDYLSVDLSNSIWAVGKGAVIAPQYNLIAQSIFKGIFDNVPNASVYETILRNQMQILWGDNTTNVFDRVLFKAYETGDLSLAAVNISNARHASLIVGGKGAQSITGTTGNDLIIGGNGDDTLYGGRGNDIFVGGAGNDTYYDRSGTNVIMYTGLHTYAGQYPIFIPVSITDGPSADVMTVNKGSLGKDTVSVDRIVLTTLDDTVTLSKNTVTTSITIDGGEGSDTLFLKDSAYSEVSSLYLRGASNPAFNIMISKDSYSPYSDPSLYSGVSAGFKNFEKLSAERMNIITDGKMGFTNSINGNINISAIQSVDYSPATQSAIIHLSSVNANDNSASIGGVVQTYNAMIKAGVGTNFGDTVYLDQAKFTSGLGNDTIYVSYTSPTLNRANASQIEYTGGKDIIYTAGLSKVLLGNNILGTDIQNVEMVATDKIVITFKNNDSLTLTSIGYPNLGYSYYTYLNFKNYTGTFRAYLGISPNSENIAYTPYQSNGDDIFNSHKGNDRLYGGEGSDTYVFNIGDGQDYIADIAHFDDYNNVDIISFGAGITKDNIRLAGGAFVTSGRYDSGSLEIYYGTSDKIIIQDQLQTSGSGRIEKVRFNDGTFLDLTHGLSMVGTSGADQMSGTPYNDVISGLRGNDTLSGGAGEDTYIYNLGDGNDILADRGLAGENDTIVFGAGITASNISITSSKYAIIISMKDGAKIEIDTLNGASGFIETLKFYDGSTLNLTTDQYTIIGTSGNDIMYGTFLGDTMDGGDGMDSIYGGSGNDVLNGGKERDSLYGGAGDELLKGGALFDTYIYNLGDGFDTISDAEGINYINFGTGIVKSDLTTRLAGNDLILSLKGDDVIKIVAQSSGTVYFSNGETISLPAVSPANGGTMNVSITGTSGDDNLVGTAGNNVIYGLSGNDILNGGLGNDTLNGGDGIDTASYSDAPSAVTVNLAITSIQNTSRCRLRYPCFNRKYHRVSLQ